MKVAWPEASALVSKGVAPSLKTSWPVGVPVAGERAETVAVKIIAWPEQTGLAEEIKATVLSAALTMSSLHAAENSGFSNFPAIGIKTALELA